MHQAAPIMKVLSPLFLVVMLLAAIQPSRATDMILVPVAVSVSPASVVKVDLLITNPAGEPTSLRLGSQLAGRLHAGSARSANVILTSAENTGDQTVAAGGFARIRYTFSLPVGFLGPVVLEIPGREIQPVMFSSQAFDLAARASAPVPDADKPAEVQMMHETALRRGTRSMPGVTGYEPVYFGIGGRRGLNAKFQISFKYQPVDIWPVYVAYTQTSFWDLHTTSKAFKDTAYQPRLFYLQEETWVSANNQLRLGFEGGIGHESNGRGIPESRSINIAYGRPRFTWAFSEGKRLVFAPMFYSYQDKKENPDITDYRGHTDVYLGLLTRDWRLSTTLRKGTRGNYGSMQVDAVLPLRVTDQWFAKVGAYGANGFIFLQYFNGWGESILDYNRKLPVQVRAGLMLVP